MYDVLFICLFVLMTGACVGSFLNVVALRALTKESIVFPASKCPVCNEPIKWFDKIPVLSYFLTFRGKCRNCGCKVSKQYPIVEALTAILFLAVFIAFGVTLKTLLLWFLLSIAIVITITDLKKEYIFDVHMWIFIAAAVLYSVLFKYGINNAFSVCVGLLVGALTMEGLAKLSYYLVRKEPASNNSDDALDENQQPVEQSENKEESSENQECTETVQAECIEQPEQEPSDNSKDLEEEDIDINDYVQKYKRAFGEGDTYLAAGVGALLGWKYFLVSVALAIIVQAVCILPQFFVGLYKQKEYRLLTSLSLFTVVAVFYWILTNIYTFHLFIVLGIVAVLAFLAIDSIKRLKQTVNQQGFIAIPFGPALLFSAFMLLFFGQGIVSFLKKYIFMMIG